MRGVSHPLAVLILLSLCGMGGAYASAPSVAELDAVARAAGNRIDLAQRLGQEIFSSTWPAQVSQVSVNTLGTHTVVGIRLWGVKFHEPITRGAFLDEVRELVRRSFSTLPQAEEVDLWASVPIAVGKGVIVSGDLAKPTTRTVYSISVRRGAGPSTPFWDQDWAHSAFKSGR